MADIAKCAAKLCCVSAWCQRTQVASHPRQSWVTPKQTGPDCPLYLPIDRSSSMSAPSDQDLQAFYSQWFEDNYCTKPTKPAPAVIAFAQAALQQFAGAADPQDAAELH
jgi:hypothetical protein